MMHCTSDFGQLLTFTVAGLNGKFILKGVTQMAYYEIQRLEYHMRRATPVRGLEQVNVPTLHGL